MLKEIFFVIASLPFVIAILNLNFVFVVILFAMSMKIERYICFLRLSLMILIRFFLILLNLLNLILLLKVGFNMSAKNTKIKINIPKYDVEGQMNFLIQLCEVYSFDVRTLITLIFADWINLFQIASSENSGNSEKAFHSFLATCEKTASSLRSMREVIENEDKK